MTGWDVAKTKRLLIFFHATVFPFIDICIAKFMKNFTHEMELLNGQTWNRIYMI